MKRLLYVAVMLVGCGGSVAQSGDAGPDASIPDGSFVPDGGDGGACEGKDAGCWVRPFECYGGPRPTLAEIEKLYAGLAPTDPCPGGSVWVERHESCGLVEIHSFQGPPFSYWFDAKSGNLVGISTRSDTGCSGYGVFDFPCDGIVTCKHLCGAFSGTVEQPQCPPPKDAGPG